MNAERTEAYRRLISMLLTYPDRAAKILTQNATLLDADLMKMMEQVASQMAAGKSQEAATFLKTLIAQLQDELTVTTGRIKITQSLNSDRLEEFFMEIVEQKKINSVREEERDRQIYSQSDKEKIYYLNSKNTYLNNLKQSKIRNRDCYEYSWSKWVALAILMGIGLVFIHPLANLSGQLNFFDNKSQSSQEQQ